MSTTLLLRADEVIEWLGGADDIQFELVGMTPLAQSEHANGAKQCLAIRVPER